MLFSLKQLQSWCFQSSRQRKRFHFSLDSYAEKLCRSLVYNLTNPITATTFPALEDKSFSGGFSFLNIYPQGIAEWFNRAVNHYQALSKSVKGRFVMFVHNSVTYLSQSEATTFRKRIINEGHLKAVVNLPKFLQDRYHSLCVQWYLILHLYMAR